MDKVEKVARALCRYTWEHDVLADRLDAFVEQNWRDSVPAAEAALAAMGEREGEALSGHGDYTPVTIRSGTVASPRPEAVEEAVKALRMVSDTGHYIGNNQYAIPQSTMQAVDAAIKRSQ